MTHPIFDIWNEEAPPAFPAARKLTASRLDKCKTRWEETPGESYDRKMIYWIDLIRSCKKRPFLCGKKGWVMDFNYLIRNDTIHVELSEGRFEEKKPAQPTDDRPPYYQVTLETRQIIGLCAQCAVGVEGTLEQAKRWIDKKSTCSGCFLKSPEYRTARLGGRKN